MASKVLSAAALVRSSLGNMMAAWHEVKFTKDLPLFPPLDYSGAVFPGLVDFLPALYACIAMSVGRYILHRLVFKRIAVYCRDIKEVRGFQRSRAIDPFLNRKGQIQKHEIERVSKIVNMAPEDVASYARTFRRNKSNEAKISKFIEAMWRFIFYSLFVVVGVVALFYPEPQAWLPLDGTFWGLYRDWPHHPMTDLMRFYYMVELGGYLHQLMWTEVSRSDSLEMISHHIITITLIVVSYSQNFTRVGSLFLILHDISDIFLEFAKCVHYTSMVKGREWLQVYCDALFAVFAVSFFVLRLVMLPALTIVSFWNEGWMTLTANWWGAWIFVVCSYGLQFLHCFWFYLIMKMVVRMLIVGNVEQDIRSDDEAESDDDHAKGRNVVASVAAAAEGVVGVEGVRGVVGSHRHVVHADSAAGVAAGAEEMKVGRKKTKKVD